MARRPDGTLPHKLPRRRDLVGGYRMLNNAKVTHQGIVQDHQVSCLERLSGFTGKVLLLHDTTVLDYSGLDIAEMGQVGDGHGRGFYAHNSLAIIPRTREVVGLFNQILHRRAKVAKGETKKQLAAREDRESRLWKQAVIDLPALPGGIELIDVSDRGSDISEYIAHELQAGRRFIVRSGHNRVTVDDQGQREVQKLHDQLRGLGPMGSYQLQRVPAEGGGWTEATIGLAWQRVRLLPPRQARGEHDSEPMALWALIARQTDAPAGQEPIEWILLSNQRVESFEQARETVDDYACRWMIEDYHKGMKTGCGIEQLQMTTAHGLSNTVAILSVLAVHLLRLRCNARNEQMQHQPARLHEEQLKVQLAARDSNHANWRTMTVWEFHVAVARMGGYQLNPQKRPPGWLILWRGYIRLEDMCAGVRLWNEKRCVQT